MQAYQVRMFNEYNELVDRYKKLNKIINKSELGTLDFELNCPLELLKEQSDAMWNYINALWARSKFEDIDVEMCIEHEAYTD